MAFWRGERLLLEGSALIEPFSETQIDCNSYTLRMGDRYFRTSDGASGNEEDQKKHLLSEGDSFVIPAGQFAYLLTKEVVRVPTNAMAFISMRTQMKFAGLINVSGFHVDPGYEGKLLFAVFNAGPSPITISENERLFKIWFCDLEELPSEQKPSERFWKKPGDGVYDIDNKLIHGMSPPIVSLQGLAKELRSQASALEKLESSTAAKFAIQQPTLESLTTIYRNIVTGIVTGLTVAAVVAVLALVWPTFQQAGVELRDRIFPSAAAPAAPTTNLGAKPPQPQQQSHKPLRPKS